MADVDGAAAALVLRSRLEQQAELIMLMKGTNEDLAREKTALAAAAADLRAAATAADHRATEVSAGRCQHPRQIKHERMIDM
jgi:hypothetical protein